MYGSKRADAASPAQATRVSTALPPPPSLPPLPLPLPLLGMLALLLLLAACGPRPPAPGAPPASASAASGVAAGAAGAAASAPALAVQPVAPEDVARLFERRVGQPQAGTPPFVAGEVIVRMRPGRAVTLAAGELARLQVAPDSRAVSGGERVYRLLPAATRQMGPQAVRERTLAAVRAFAARPDVEYAQPNFIVGIARVPNDPGYAGQWHYADNGTGGGRFAGGINLPQVWDTQRGSANVVVAVIDTGILAAHPDIAGSPNLVAGYDMITDPAIANDGGGRDADPTDPGDGYADGECGPGSGTQPDSWHGTHVAGTVGVGHTDNGTGVAGIAWAVKVQAVRVLGKCGGTMADIHDGIRWAAGLQVPGVPANATPAKAINMSLGGGAPCSASPATQSAINDAIAAGATVVVAAGNSAADAAGFVPAGCTGVITVAAGDARGHLVTRYSNYGTRVDLLAPGGDTQRDDTGDGQNDGVLSMVQGGYARYNGTSMASPHVAGVVALMLAARPALAPAQVLAELKAQALPRDTTQCPRPCGAGLLNARAVLGPGAPPPPDGARVALAPNTATLNIGASTPLMATVSAGNAPLAGRTVTFASSNAAVATVSPASAVTDNTGQARATVAALTTGTATITAAAEGAQASAAITVAAKVSAWPLGDLVSAAWLQAGTISLAQAVLAEWGTPMVAEGTLLRHASGFVAQVDAACTAAAPVLALWAALLAVALFAARPAWKARRMPAPRTVRMTPARRAARRPSARRLVVAALVGALALALVNQIRLVALLWVGVHLPASFAWLHDVVGPLVLLTVGGTAVWFAAKGVERKA